MSKKTIDASALENETPTGKINKNINSVTVDATNLEWLINEDVSKHLDKENLEIVSSKYDENREPKVQEGLKALAELEIDGMKINPLIILMGKWWEHKPVRKEIKNMIDAEAEAKGFEASDYLQNVLGAQIDKFAEFQTAIDRVKYAKTYFLPRGGVKSTIKMKQMRINGDLYNVPIVKLNGLLLEYPTHAEDKKVADKLRKAVQEVSELVTSIEDL